MFIILGQNTMPYLPKDILISGAQELGITLTEENFSKIDEFAQFVIKTNEKFNLTRITEPFAFATEHILDSFTVLNSVNLDPKIDLIDIGTGAGFPGVPIAIIRPDIKITLVDATNKKIQFLREAAKMLNFDNVELIHGRAEELGRDLAYREHYDVAISRALAEMKVLAELCIPLVKVSGLIVAQKGVDLKEELTNAFPLIGQLGGRFAAHKNVKVPHTQLRRSIIIIEKTKPTPKSFPRHYARIIKK